MAHIRVNAQTQPVEAIKTTPTLTVFATTAVETKRQNLREQ